MSTRYQETSPVRFVVLALVGVVVFVGGLMYGIPKYRVWQRELAGQAELKQAEWSRRIRVAEAESEKDAALSLAEAEVARARGAAEANLILGESLKNNEAYLRYLYISSLEKAQKQGATVIYVPTEAGLPILEAGRGTR